MEGKEDPDNRRDFPGGFPGDTRNAFTPEGRKPTEQRMFEWTRSWIRLRAEHSAIRHGRLVDLYYDDDSYVFARQDQHETVIVAFNRGDKEKKVNLPAGSISLKDGAELSALIGTTSGGARVANGSATLTLPRSSAAMFVVR
jgi:glycosidase